jgi:predicted dehydrogenase
MPQIPGDIVTIAPAAPGFDQHAALQADFARAIRSGTAPLAPLDQGLASLGLANAILAAGILGRRVTLPIDPGMLAEAMRVLSAATAAATPASARAAT